MNGLVGFAIILALLIGGFVLIEWSIRRSEKRKEPKE